MFSSHIDQIKTNIFTKNISFQIAKKINKNKITKRTVQQIFTKNVKAKKNWYEKYLNSQEKKLININKKNC